MEPLRHLATLSVESLDQTKVLGKCFAAHLLPGDCLGLVGTLGAGKTTFTQSLLHALGIPASKVTSPTFSLIQTYAIERGNFFHIDAYRVRDDDEFFELGIEEIWEDSTAITCIEWADKWAAWMPRRTLCIEVTWSPDEQRSFALRSSDQQWQTRIPMIVQQWELEAGSSCETRLP